MERGEDITLDVSNIRCDLRETIQYSRLQIEAVKLRMKGLSETKIADRLGVRYQSIHRALKAFEKVAPVLLKDFFELEKVRYWHRARIARIKAHTEGDDLRKARDRQEELVNLGYWPFEPPIGYVRQQGNLDLALDPEKAELVSKIYAGRMEGKGSIDLERETGLGNATILYMLRNSFYCGLIKRQGKIIPGKHPPIISKETWESVQMPIDYPLSRNRVAPYGYRWIGGQLRKERDKTEQVCSVFALRAKRESLNRISESTGVKMATVFKMLTNPIYRGVTPDGKSMPSSFEAFVDSNLWWAANRVHTQSVREIIEERRRRKKQDVEVIARWSVPKMV